MVHSGYSCDKGNEGVGSNHARTYRFVHHPNSLMISLYFTIIYFTYAFDIDMRLSLRTPSNSIPCLTIVKAWFLGVSLEVFLEIPVILRYLIDSVLV